MADENNETHFQSSKSDNDALVGNANDDKTNDDDGGFSRAVSAPETRVSKDSTRIDVERRAYSEQALNEYQHQRPQHAIVDNSRSVYIPVRLVCGVTVLCRPEVLVQCPEALNDIEFDLKECFRILPKSLHCLIGRTRIWVNHCYYYGVLDDITHLHHMTTHHHVGWLQWACDRPDKTLGIEIYDCFEYRRMRLHWNGCGLLMHELCHLVHQLVLSDGLDNDRVKEAFVSAKQSGQYQNILRRDWAGKDKEYDMAYAMVDFKEFFAEMSVTYFSQGYLDLGNNALNSNMESCCPPIMEQTVLRRIREKCESACQPLPHRLCGENYAEDEINCRVPREILERALRWARDPISYSTLPHCNKFFPFTRFQLKAYDPSTFKAIDQLWTEIRAWKDPLQANLDRQCWAPCWAPLRTIRSPDSVML